MNKEFFEALAMLEKEKGISAEYLLSKIENAVKVAVRRDFGGKDNVVCQIDPVTQTFNVYLRKKVVEEVTNPEVEMLPEEARKYKADAQLDEEILIQLDTKKFGRIAAQTAKHVIRQGIREGERRQILEELQSRNQELVSALVLKVDPKTGNVVVEIGKAEAVLPKSEQVEGEVLREGDRIKVYIVDVKETEKGLKAMISRTHPGLVKRLFEMEVPEIYDGIVEIKAISREAGSRTKIAVHSNDDNVDSVGACIGARGVRVNKIVDELNGEKIDIIKYSEVPSEFIAAALAPAEVIKVEIDSEDSRTCHVIVPDGQLSLAIGNRGQNARLAAKLTGWKIDIRPASAANLDE